MVGYMFEKNVLLLHITYTPDIYTRIFRISAEFLGISRDAASVLTAGIHRVCIQNSGPHRGGGGGGMYVIAGVTGWSNTSSVILIQSGRFPASERLPPSLTPEGSFRRCEYRII